MIGKSMITLALVASFVAVASAHLTADGYDHDTCYKYNTHYGSIYSGNVFSCEECCHFESMNWEILFDQETKKQYCACKAAEPLEVMDRACFKLSPNEAGCGACCKAKKGKDWEAVKNIFGEDECRCKGPFVEYKPPAKEEEQKHHHLHNLFHH